MSRTKAEKRQQLSSDDEDDDVEQKDDDLELLMDEEERERFNQMSEKEREIEIFKRLEQREIMKTREQIKRKLEMAAGKGANERGRQKKKRRISADSDASDGEADDPTTKSRHKARATSDEEEEGELDQDTSEDETLAGDGGGDSSQKKKGKGTTSAAVKSEASESVFDAEYHKPSELANKQSKKKAMTDLLNKRREKKQAEEKKKKEAQKAALDLDEIFGNDDKEDGKSMSSISSSTSSSRSSSPECNKSRSPSPAVALPISTRPDLLKAQIIRRRLARIVHAPFFAKVAIGCFVRVQIGTNEGRPTYRIAQVMDVVETAKIYEVEPGTDIRTNKGFKLKISNNEPHRVIRLEFVSNGEFTDTEFAFWLKRMQETASPMPTMDFVERKGKEVRDALGYNYTDAEINLMVKEKQRFKRQPHNFAFQKAELLKQKEEAAQDGDTERMRDLQQQINDFEEKAKKIDYQRTKSLSAVTAINQRNREHMKQIFLGTDRHQHSEAMQVKDDDPFTRKSARMKMVTGGRIKQETTEEANSGTGIQQKTTVLSSSSTHAIGASALPASSSKTGGGDPSTSRRLSISSDLFSAHGIEINIDFGKMIPASSSSGFRAPPIGGINNSMLQQQQHPTSHHPLQQKPSTGSSRTLTLEEYKRKYSTRLT